MLAFDVGATIGGPALVRAQAVGAGGRVYASEQTPPILERLRANIALNRFENIEVFPLCLSDRAGQETLFVPLDNEYNQGLASMHRPNLGEHCKEVFVTSTTLDEFVLDHCRELLVL